MCGIVGYIGTKQATPILLDGLKRLEYRGYDSAGVAVLGRNGLQCKKAKGRIAELEKQDLSGVKGRIGISHTRWATHGEPSDRNAHPHWDCTEKIMVVHNGIIENYDELRTKLKKEGHKFYSDTDTEVLAHLIEKYLKDDLRQAVQKALREVEGTYGIAVISEHDPEKIIAARHGSPLVIGIKDGEYFISSDVQALLPHTRKVIYPDDGELIELTTSGYNTVTVDNKEIEKEVEEVEWSEEQAEKGGFAHYMLKEIFEQPQVVRNASAGRVVMEEGVAHLGGLNMTDDELRKVKRVLFIACGTAYYAGLVGKYMIEECAGIPVDVEFASELRYKRQILDKDTLVFVISQSGETADTLAAMHEIQRQGHKVLGISNVVGSTIARESDGGVFIHAGPEIGVASTKAFIGQLTVLAILALQFGRLKGLSVTDGKKIAAGILKLPSQIEEILEQSIGIRELAKNYKDYPNFLYLGRKFNYPIALEGALKLKEISYIHAEAYPAGEMKHGPIALIDKNFPTFVIDPEDSVYQKTVSNIEEIKARRGKIIGVISKSDSKLRKIVNDAIFIPQTEEMLEPLLTVIPCQLFAYHLAVLKDRDVDKPRNLAKSVTVE